jgi:hypothetical protein
MTQPSRVPLERKPTAKRQFGRVDVSGVICAQTTSCKGTPVNPFE